MTKQPPERELLRLLVSFSRLRSRRIEPRPGHVSVPRPAILRRRLALHVVEEAPDLPIQSAWCRARASNVLRATGHPLPWRAPHPPTYYDYLPAAG